MIRHLVLSNLLEAYSNKGFNLSKAMSFKILKKLNLQGHDQRRNAEIKILIVVNLSTKQQGETTDHSRDQRVQGISMEIK